MSYRNLLICLHPYSNKGGATNKVIQLLNKIDKKKFKIVYIYLKKDTPLEFKSHIKVIKLKSKRTLFAYSELKRILVKYNQEKFDKKLLVSNQNYSNVLIYFLLRNFKNIKSVLIERNHLDELYFYTSLNDYVKKFIIKIMMKFTYRYSNKIIGNSKKLSSDLAKFVNKSVETIYSPTNFKELSKMSKAYKPKRILYDKSKIRILSASRFTKRKDLITLLNAFNIIHSKYQNVELLLIGHGPEFQEIKKFIDRHNLKKKVFLISHKDNPYPYFLISNLYVMPSLYEGCPNSIIEATALNLPVLSSNCNSGPKEILLNGRGGYLFEKGNYIELANKIELFINNKKVFLNKMNVAKRNIFRFNEKKILKDFMKIFNNI